jgi:hypothetical protein
LLKRGLKNNPQGTLDALTDQLNIIMKHDLKMVVDKRSAVTEGEYTVYSNYAFVPKEEEDKRKVQEE